MHIEQTFGRDHQIQPSLLQHIITFDFIQSNYPNKCLNLRGSQGGQIFLKGNETETEKMEGVKTLKKDLEETNWKVIKPKLSRQGLIWK